MDKEADVNNRTQNWSDATMNEENGKSMRGVQDMFRGL